MDNNDFITLAENLFTEEASSFVPRTAAVTNPDYKVVVNKDLVGDRELLDEDAKAIIWDEDKVDAED